MRRSTILLPTLALALWAGPVRSDLIPEAPLHYPFDHVGIILEPEVIRAMAETPLLRDEFAHPEYRKTWIEGGGWTSLLLFGGFTFLEFTDGARTPGLEVGPGDGMVAFHSGREGGLDRLVARMSDQYPESSPSKGLRYLNVEGQRMPFRYTATLTYDAGHEGFGAWATEYHPDFKNQMSDGRIPKGEISRFKPGEPVRHYPERLFQDVVSVTAAVSKTRRQNVVNLMEELGYEIEARDDATTCTGPENRLTLIPKVDGQKYSVTRVVVSLTRPKMGQKVYRFGSDILLTFGDGREAVWEFGEGI